MKHKNPGVMISILFVIIFIFAMIRPAGAIEIISHFIFGPDQKPFQLGLGRLDVLNYFPHEQAVLTLAENGNLYMWDLKATSLKLIDFNHPLAQKYYVPPRERNRVLCGMLKLPGNTQVAHIYSYNPGTYRLAMIVGGRKLILYDMLKHRKIGTYNSFHPIDFVKFSPMGKYLALFVSPRRKGQDYTIQLFNPETCLTGLQIKELSPGKLWTADYFTFSPSEDTAVIPEKPNLLVFRDLKTGDIIKKLDLEEESSGSVSWSPDETLLACGTGKQEIKIYDFKVKRFVQKLYSGLGCNHRIFWSKDKTSIGAVSPMGTVAIWNRSNGRNVYRLDGHTDNVLFMTFHPENGILLAAFVGGEYLRLNPKNNEVTRFSPRFKDFDPEPRNMTWLPDGKLAFPWNNHVQIIDPETGELLSQTALNTESESVSPAITTVSPDGTRATAGRGDGEFYLYDFITGKPLKTLWLLFTELPPAWSPDSMRLAYTFSVSEGLIDKEEGAEGIKPEKGRLTFLRYADGKNGTMLKKLQVKRGDGRLVWSPDSSFLAAAYPGNSILLWNPDTGEERTFLFAKREAGFEFSGPELNFTFRDNDSIIFTRNKSVIQLDFPTAESRELLGLPARITALAVDNARNRAAAGDENGIIYITPLP
ncbi:MAG: WD40 repeat domain-containing protein [Chloroflexi bacterium]|nr:WD40 repeat domain-containing protein [Chloroflexota bacterium]